MMHSLNDKESNIYRSLRNVDVSVNLGEFVELRNFHDNTSVIAEVISQTTDWLAEFRIVKP